MNAGSPPGEHYNGDVPADLYHSSMPKDPHRAALPGSSHARPSGPYRPGAGQDPPPPQPAPPWSRVSSPPTVSGPLPQVPAVATQAEPADPYPWPSADPGRLGYGGQVPPDPPGPLHPEPPGISGPMPGPPGISGPMPGPPGIPGPTPEPPWPDHQAILGPMPSVPAEPDRFHDQDADRRPQGDYADEADPDDAYGWEPEGEEASGPIVPMGPGGRRSRRGDGRARRRGRRFSAPLIALLVLALFLSGGGIVGYHFLREYVVPPDYSGSGYGSVVVQIQQNQTATDVARTLFGVGVVASTRAFAKAAEQSSQQTGLEPGFYRLRLHMKAALAFGLLLNPGARIQLKVTIPEGLRASQIVAALGAKSGIPLRDYHSALADPAALGLPSYAGNQPEGYLFPATYSVQPRMTAAGVLRAMVLQFDAEAARIHLVTGAQSVNLTPAEAVTVASLVQAEGGWVADFPKIARVIYNRLAMNMPLQLDSTVMYALHTYGILATNQQLQVRSAYNTYQHSGLPPGPIDSPGDAAIHAALHPAAGNWLYFVTVNPKTGLTQFTSSQATFVQLRAELEKNLGQGG